MTCRNPLAAQIQSSPSLKICKIPSSDDHQLGTVGDCLKRRTLCTLQDHSSQPALVMLVRTSPPRPRTEAPQAGTNPCFLRMRYVRPALAARSSHHHSLKLSCSCPVFRGTETTDTNQAASRPPPQGRHTCYGGLVRLQLCSTKDYVVDPRWRDSKNL